MSHNPFVRNPEFNPIEFDGIKKQIPNLCDTVSQIGLLNDR
jgi:hypothetical protein